MRTIYIADDGKEFDNEFDCEDYEWMLNHPYLEDVCFYDENNKLLDNIFSEDTYEKTEKVVVLDKNAIKDLHEFVVYTGFCCYGSIDECGVWIFNEEEYAYIKV